MTALELAEELVVQIVSISQYDQRRIVHGGMEDDLASVKEHGKTFSRPLRMPDDTTTPVTVGTGRFYRRGDGLLDGVELVVARDDLVNLITVRIFLEHDKVLE